MATNKTTETENSVMDYINAITDEKKRKDCTGLIDLFSKQTGFAPKMWGAYIVGFGSYHYKYESGRESDAALVALAARANAIVLYLHAGADDMQEQLKKLGKYKSGKGCVYINQLADINIDVLKKMIDIAIMYMRNKYPA